MQDGCISWVSVAHSLLSRCGCLLIFLTDTMTHGLPQIIFYSKQRLQYYGVSENPVTCLPTPGEVLSLMQKLSLSAAGCGHSSPSAGTLSSSCGKAGRELAPQGRLQGHFNLPILKKLELQAPPDRPFQALGRVWECVHTVTLFVK